MTPWFGLQVPATSAVLLLVTLVASLPSLLAIGSTPLPRGGAAASSTHHLQLVRTASGRWFADGMAVEEAPLQRRLGSARQGLVLHLLPSPALPTAEVARLMAWLRHHSGAPVQLERADRG